jgi:hypothetical protein
VLQKPTIKPRYCANASSETDLPERGQYLLIHFFILKNIIPYTNQKNLLPPTTVSDGTTLYHYTDKNLEDSIG